MVLSMFLFHFASNFICTAWLLVWNRSALFVIGCDVCVLACKLKALLPTEPIILFSSVGVHENIRLNRWLYKPIFSSVPASGGTRLSAARPELKLAWLSLASPSQAIYSSFAGFWTPPPLVHCSKHLCDGGGLRPWGRSVEDATLQCWRRRGGGVTSAAV